ncbi:MAG: type II toxin-antitoxin system VapC family toxin [Candidatus Binatia bacterium]
MELKELLRQPRLALDTVVFIYFIEEHPAFLPLVRPLFEAIDAERVEGVTSALTLLETLVVPYRAGDDALAARYETLLTRSRGLRVVEIDRECLRRAARLRAVHRVRTPDAIQLAAALARGSRSFVTNDRDLPVIPGIEVVQLSSLAGPATVRRS